MIDEAASRKPGSNDSVRPGDSILSGSQLKSTNAQRPTGSVNIWSEGVVYPCMKRLFALMFCVAVLGFVTVPTSKAQEFSISIGGDGYCYPQSYDYRDYYGSGYGYRGRYYDPYYSGYSQQIYYSSGNPYGYRRSYYRRGHRYIYRGGYRGHHHHDWQD